MKSAAATDRDASPPSLDSFIEGETRDGKTFQVPKTRNVVTSVALPHKWNVMSFFTVALVLISADAVWRDRWSTTTHVLLFFFWRACYNIGLGVLLDIQSRHRVISKHYIRVLTEAPKSLLGRLYSHIACRSVDGHPDAVNEFPHEFNAWLVYRSLVDLILVNDSLNYVLLGAKCFSMPDELSLLLVLQYGAGLFLILFNYWAKVDAHRCIGDYCWYWGDFFFNKRQQLTFDGIFELFPHPMYTVGYSLFYGYSLICRSYTLLLVSLLAHMLQLAFLVAVEEPHIERTYGSSKPKLDPQQYNMLYDPKSGLFPGSRNSIMLVHLDLYRSSDFSLLAFIVYSVVCSAFLSESMVVGQVLVWILVHWIGLGYVLWAQSKRQLWTRHYTNRGRTLYEAFDNWKRLFNLSSTMKIAVFVGLCVRLMPPVTWEELSVRRVTLTIGGLVLVALNVWSSMSTLQAIGDFGWFYGDFFIPRQHYEANLVYTGIYRFLNNPDCVTGVAGYYGLALIAQSYTVFSLALFSHLLNIVFLNTVEIPHMKTIYARKMRPKPPIQKRLSGKLRNILPVDGSIEETLQAQARRIKRKAMRELFQVYKRLGERSSSPESAKGDFSVSVDDDAVLVGDELDISFRAPADHSDTDWIGIYPADVASMPGHSDGRWLYVPTGPSGTVRFFNHLLPRSAGVYQVRYHVKNSYNVVADVPIHIMEVDHASASEGESDGSAHSHDD